MTKRPPSILIADDDDDARVLLMRMLGKCGFDVVPAADGRDAVRLMRGRPFDLLLLDIMMPHMDGYQVLEVCRQDPELSRVPVIVISGVDDLAGVARCVKLGAADFLLKPFNGVLLEARVGACLEQKRLRDVEREYLGRLQRHEKRYRLLLQSILPQPIIDRLSAGDGTARAAEHFGEVTVVFASVHEFAYATAGRSPAKVVEILNQMFCAFDRLAEQHGVDRIKTIGETYMAAAGVPRRRGDHAEAVAELALAMQVAVTRVDVRPSQPLSLRIGINTGPVMAGVIGTTKFAYELWGPTVTTAAQMEAYGLGGAIQVSAATHARLRDAYMLQERGSFYVTGVGEVCTYVLTGRRAGQPPAT
jgi:adenylate cyclase